MQVNENVRGADVFVIQPTCPPVNDTLMELLIMIDALKRASARRITAVLPVLRLRAAGPQGAAARADLGQARGRPAEAAGVDRVLALDLHAGQIQGFFNIPVDHLFAGPVVIDRLPAARRTCTIRSSSSPDAGGVERARAIAKRFDAGLAIIDKRREGPNSAVAMHLIGDVKGKRRRRHRRHDRHRGDARRRR